jgi:hypothetical protein
LIVITAVLFAHIISSSIKSHSQTVHQCGLSSSVHVSSLRLLLGLLLLSEFCLSGVLKRAGAVGFHDLRLEVGAGAQVAIRQIHDAGGLGLLDWLLSGSLVVANVIALLKSRHLLSFTNFEHLILR